ncbi:hypothetical protein ADK38_06755 [Streptomyces varsoviensis]|uniref:Uncharacterized protein n=1 Tax=Streptomyces varsoviensis TaxID=67373 RepID=A0ABR5JBG7_9ACTN|nr:hypothetical protein ADK38_06755 [Streptomyces varsoviensis]
MRRPVSFGQLAHPVDGDDRAAGVDDRTDLGGLLYTSLSGPVRARRPVPPRRARRRSTPARAARSGTARGRRPRRAGSRSVR